MEHYLYGYPLHKGILVQTGKAEERFFIAQYGYTEPITGIDAEIEACNRVTDIRTTHRELGIEKSCKTYHYMKFAIMERIEQGITVSDTMKFKMYGEELKINLN